MNNWYNWVEILKLHVSQIALFAAATKLPSSTFKEETINVGTIRGKFWELCPFFSVKNFIH